MLISSDVYDIADRLKEIDPNYTLHYNRKTKKFELWGKRNELLIVFPYSAVDARMVEHARRTRIERSRELIREIEENNRKILESRELETTKNAQDNLKEIAEKYYVERRKRAN